MVEEILDESVAQLYPDDLYRKKDRHIVIAQMESVVPLHSATLEPRIWGGGTSEYTWGKVQKFFSRHPLARKGLPPGHFFCEYLDEDYVVYNGCPLSNRSWFLQRAVEARVLPLEYLDDILIVLQENYSVENVERRCWKVLANTTLTPLMRLFGIPKERVVFFEKLADREAVVGPDWPFRWREPTFLDPVIVNMILKHYEKR